MSGRRVEADPARVADAVRQARSAHELGGGAVLDRLLAAWPGEPSALAAALHRLAGVAVADPAADSVDFSLLGRAACADWQCVPLRRDTRWLLASADPWNEALLRRVAQHTGANWLPAAARQSDLDRWLQVDGGPRPDLAVREPGGAVSEVVGFVRDAIAAGFRRGASDVHFESDRGGITARHRIDGVLGFHRRLQEAQRAEEVISHIKVQALLDITERRLPQDGRFRFPIDGRVVDLRVSVMPSVHGEDAVLRILDKAHLRSPQQTVSLDTLGFDAATAAGIRQLAAAPSGMLLVTGPTGSGKTTTVYAALSEADAGLEKIVTIEDPVEYELPGVLQIPVNDRKGLTFARGLRSILRHDPDRILVGEIRDAETAEIAVQSALTGHLVFTTVHANSVADVIGRFRHFGLDMFGFMSSLNGVVVQRLLRTLCIRCAAVRAATGDEVDWLSRMGRQGVSELPIAVGCKACHGSGYRGRFVLAEVHAVDDALRDMVTDGAPLAALRAHFGRVEPLAQQAVRQLLSGRTSGEEIRRVVGWQ